MCALRHADTTWLVPSCPSFVQAFEQLTLCKYKGRPRECRALEGLTALSTCLMIVAPELDLCNCDHSCKVAALGFQHPACTFRQGNNTIIALQF
jgi:hypothetical protein